MILVTVEATFEDENIEKAVEIFEAQAVAVRRLNGCESYALYRAQNDVAIVQKWQDMAKFDAYRAGEIFAALGRDLKPMMSVPPVTTIGQIADEAG